MHKFNLILIKLQLFKQLLHLMIFILDDDIDIQNIKTLNNVSQFNFSCHKNNIHLARTGSCLRWLLLISTTMFPHFLQLTIMMPHCWVPLNYANSRITCGLELIILQLQLHNNKQYLLLMSNLRIQAGYKWLFST